MSSRKQNITRITSAAIFILMEVAALGMLSNSKSTVGDGILSRISIIKGVLWGWGDDIRYYFSLKQVNLELSRENFKLSEQLRMLADRSNPEMSLENDEVTGFTAIPAEVVKHSHNTQHNYIIINKGALDGVRPGSGIVSSKGVTGIVNSVSEHYSYALSFHNTNINISSRIGRNGDVGSLVWAGNSPLKAKLNNIPLQTQYNPGDTVWTSGHSSIFPADIPLGILEDSENVDGVKMSINVSLFKDMNSMKYVKVLVNNGYDEIHELETEEIMQ